MTTYFIVAVISGSVGFVICALLSAAGSEDKHLDKILSAQSEAVHN